MTQGSRTALDHKPVPPLAAAIGAGVTGAVQTGATVLAKDVRRWCRGAGGEGSRRRNDERFKALLCKRG